MSRKKYDKYFSHGIRPCGKYFTYLKHDCPEDLRQLVWAIHLNLFKQKEPSDWIMRFIEDAFEYLPYDKIESAMYDPYLCEDQLRSWYSNKFAEYFSSEVLQECLQGFVHIDGGTEIKIKSVNDIIKIAYSRAKALIYHTVDEFIKSEKE